MGFYFTKEFDAMSEFEPQIVAFFCNWCTFTAADLAGTSRLSYPANLKIIRVMCTGMVDQKYVLKAFLNGADGVLIGGCWPGIVITSMAT